MASRIHELAALQLTLYATMVIGGFGANSAGAAAAHVCLGRQSTIVVGPGQRDVDGSAGADVILARGSNHTIRAGTGNDRICAGGGDDRILGDAGSDWISAGPGADEIEGGNGSDRIWAGVGADTVIGSRGNDKLYGESGVDFIDAKLGDDRISGGAGNGDRLIGGVGNDQLFGGSGAEDVLRGDHGADLLDGGEGEHDVASFVVSGFDGPIAGGQGVVVDLVAGRASQDGNDQLAGIEDVVGTAFADSIRGNDSENVLYGSGGDDRLTGSGEGDRALGGAGFDVCEGVAESESCGWEDRQRGPSVEAAVPGGNAEADLTVVGREGYFVPGDLLEFRSPTDLSIEVGYEGGEWIVNGGPGLLAGEGCAALAGEARCPVSDRPDAVLLSGNSGNDRLVLNESVPSSVGGILQGDAGADFLHGGPGDDSLNGGSKDSASIANVLSGGGGDDAIANGKLLLGGEGSDLIIARQCAGQEVEGGPGGDSVSFARSYLGLGVQVRLGGSAVLPAHRLAGKSLPAGCPILGSAEPTSVGNSVERVEGSPFSDIIVGNNGANVMLGRGGDDRILGGGGGDSLVGGTGRDEMAGGRGADRLYARDGRRDKLLICGRQSLQRDVVKADPFDPMAAGCRPIP